MPLTTILNHPIAESLPFEFQTMEFSLNGWGNVDFYAKKNDVLILLEVESGQKHPNTNVVKLWPYLESETKAKIMFIHVFTPENNAPKNRLRLCNYIGNKLEDIFPDRFRYYKYNWAESCKQDLINIDTKLRELV